MYDFTYHQPSSLDEAIRLLESADDGTILAGGQTLIPTLKQRLASPSDLVALRGLPDLAGISDSGDALVIGAMNTHADVAASSLVQDRIPGLAALASGIGDAQVRNRGTLGGSIANNDPAADYPAALVALGATVKTNQREIAADDFFVDLFETALQDGEIVTAVSFPVPRKAGYAKFANPASRYAIVGVMVTKSGDEIRVAVTGAGPCVFRVPEMEQALSSRFSPSALDGITVAADGLNSDIHATAVYRANLVTVMAKRAVEAA